MPLSTGTRLGAYEIFGLIGAGGMGEVYRARDTRLRRDVALKVLPEAFATDHDRLARFTREAQALASLNHPHIAQIYGLEEAPAAGPGQPPVHALAMELVAGVTLDALLASTPHRRLPVEQVVAIGRQIADALAAAHEKGVVHRDLKPGNVMVAGDGTVKVLDFGLAKSLADESEARTLSASPTTINPARTDAGVMLGTAAYMSPEQARGQPVDKRADVWAFGCVLYETLAGQRAFSGDTVTDLLVAIMRDRPDWTRLTAATPLAVRWLIERCLDKDRAGDCRISETHNCSSLTARSPRPPLRQAGRNRVLEPAGSRVQDGSPQPFSGPSSSSPGGRHSALRTILSRLATRRSS